MEQAGAVAVAVHGGHPAPDGAGAQRHQEPGTLPDTLEVLFIALAQRGAFHQCHVEWAAGIVAGRSDQKIADIQGADHIQELVLAVEDDKLIPGAAGEPEDPDGWFAHQIISGRLMASQ